MGLTTLMLRRDEPLDDPAPALTESDAANNAITAFEQALGGRTALAEELLSAPDHTEQIHRVLELIYDPRFAQTPLAKLCAQAGILPGEFFAAFRHSAIAKANLLVMRAITKRAEDVAQDLLSKAVTHPKVCPICDGEKVVVVYPRRSPKNPKPEPREQPCAFCRGKGTVIAESDLKAQETIFELLGMLKRGTTTNINQQQVNLNKGSEPAIPVQGGLADLHKAMSGVQPLPPPPIDAEVVPSEPVEAAE